MAREIWVKATVRGIVADGWKLRPLAECGLHPLDQGDLVWAVPSQAGEIGSLECWARGIINSSNTALVSLGQKSYAPLGRADGPFRDEHGLRFRAIRNEMSRDPEIEYLPTRTAAERWCLLMSTFRGVRGTLADILILNGIRPDRLDAKKLAHLHSAIAALSMRNVGETVEIPKELV